MLQVQLSDAVDILKVMGNEQADTWKEARVLKEFDKQVLFEEWDAELLKMYKFNRRQKRLLAKITEQGDADDVEVVAGAGEDEPIEDEPIEDEPIEDEPADEQEEFEDGTDEEEEEDDSPEDEEDEEENDESEIEPDVVDDGAEDDGDDDQEDAEGKVADPVVVNGKKIKIGDWVEVNDPAYPVPYKGQLKEILNAEYGFVVTVHGREWEQAFEHMTLCGAPKRGVKVPKLNRQECVMKVLKGLKKPTAMGTIVKLSDDTFTKQGGKRKGNPEQVQKYLEMTLEILTYFGKAKVEGKNVQVV